MRMKQKLFSMFALLLMAATGAWAADGIECSASDIGKVICTDGSIYAKVSDVPTGKTAAAMIAYIDTENNYGLALALSDEGSMTWSDAKTACEGKSAVAGGTWVLPSKEQWEAMGAKESNSTSATALRDGFSSVGGTNMQSGAYWSSTANSTDANKAYRYYFTTGFYWENNVNKTVNNYVRACLTFNILVAPPTYSVTLAEGTEDAENWKVKVGEGEAQAFPVEGLLGGETVTATYSGEKKVKSVKAVKKATTSSQLSAVTTDDIGKVVCAAGHLHDAKTAVPDGCTAVGILGYVAEKGHGLILALQDAPEQEWNTINGWTSASYAGTTLKVLPDDAARGTKLTSYTTLGETAVSNWAVAPKNKYEAIFTNLGSEKNGSYGMTYDGNVNAYITTGVGGEAIAGGYWSASENGDHAWNFANYDWDSEMKSTDIYIRPVLGF